MSSVGKAPEYAYDTVSKKLVKAQKVNTPEVIIPSTNNVDPATPATQPRRGRPRRSSIYMLLEDQGTNQFINQTRRDLYGRPSKKTNMAGAEKKAFDDAEEYVYEYQKMQRAKKASNRRELNDAELIEAKKRIAEKILQQNDAVADARPAEKAKQARRRLRMEDDADDTEEKMSPADLQRHQEEIDSAKGDYSHLLRMRTREHNYDQQSMKAEFRKLFQKKVDKIAGPGYFERNYPTTSPTAKSKSSFNNHKKSVKEFLDRVFS
jgi:hypothetical protein